MGSAIDVMKANQAARDNFYAWCVGFLDYEPEGFGNEGELAEKMKNSLIRMARFASLGNQFANCITKIRDDFLDV